MDYTKHENKSNGSVRIIELPNKDALDALMSNDFYCTTELPEYFDFSSVLKYAAESVGDKSLNECINGDCQPESLHGVNLDVITNKDGRYAVRPLTWLIRFFIICSLVIYAAIRHGVQ